MILTLLGDDNFGLRAELKRCVSEFVQKHGDLALEKIDGDEATSQQIIDALQNMPFLADAKMVVVESLEKHKDLIEKLAEIVPNIPDTTAVVFVQPKPDKRAKYYKSLQKNTTCKEFSSSNERDLSGWILEQAKQANGEISRTDANYLVARVGVNKSLLANEIEKLVTHNAKISRADIDELCEPLPQSTIFQLLDAAFGGNTKLTMEIYEDQRKQRVEPMAIIGMIAWQLNILAIVKTAQGRSVDEIAKTAKLNPFVVRKSMSVANKLSLTQLKKLIKDCAELDVRLKSEPINPDDAMQNLLLSISK